MATTVGAAMRFGCAAALTALLLSTALEPSAGAQKTRKEKTATAEGANARNLPDGYGPQPATENLDLAMYGRIRAEGFSHGKVMEFAGALADGIGPRLTGSPNMAKANAWTRDTLTAIGLQNAHLEDWGDFGMGWQQINTWARMVSPDPEPLWMQAAPWSPTTKGPVLGEVVYIPLNDAKELDAYKGKLSGKMCCWVRCVRRRTSPSRCFTATRTKNSKISKATSSPAVAAVAHRR